MTEWTPVAIPYVRGYDAGLGLLRATGEPRNLSIKGATTTVSGAPGGAGLTLVTRVETTEELETELGINAHANGGFGIFKADDKFDFSTKCKLNTYSLAIIIHSTQELGFLQINQLELTDAAKALAASNPADFVDQFGDCFIRGISRGGQLFVVVRIDSRDKQSSDHIKNTLTATIGTFSADAMVSLSEAVKQTKSETRILIYNQGGIAVPSSLSKPDEIAMVLAPWLATLAANAAPFSVTLAPYKIVSGFDPPQAAEIQHQRDVLARCDRLRYDAIEGLNQVEHVLDHPDDFTGVDNAALATARTGFATDLDVVSQARAWAARNPEQALEPENFARTKLARPDYKLTILPTPMPQLRSGFVAYSPAFGAHPFWGFGPGAIKDWELPFWRDGVAAPHEFWVRLPPQEPQSWTDAGYLQGAVRLAAVGWMPLPVLPSVILIHAKARMSLPAGYRFALIGSLVSLSPQLPRADRAPFTFAPIWTDHADIANAGEFDLNLRLSELVPRPFRPEPGFGLPVRDLSYFIELALVCNGRVGPPPDTLAASSTDIQVASVSIES